MRQPVSIAVRGLMLVATIPFMAASIVHFGVPIPIGPVRIYDPFAGTAVPEAILAVVLGSGMVALLIGRRPAGG